MDRHAATRRLRHLAQAAGIPVTRAHPYAAPHIRHDHARRRRGPARRADRRPSRRPRAPPCGMTGPARTLTVTPTTSSPPRWPPAPDQACVSRGLCAPAAAMPGRQFRLSMIRGEHELDTLASGSCSSSRRWPADSELRPSAGQALQGDVAR